MMQLFLWERLERVSDRWHCEGGLVIVAENYEMAKAMLASNPDITIDKEPDRIFEIGRNAEPEYFVFPDAGCC